MPPLGEALRHKIELDEVKERISSLLRQLEPDDQSRFSKQRLTKQVTRRVSRLVNLEVNEPEEAAAETFQDVYEKLEELMGKLHLEERFNVLSQVVDWFSGHTHGAQKDIAVLERADKECLRRECERAWAALGTEDRLRKKERNTIRQVQQFVISVAREHRAGELGFSDDELIEFDERLLSLSDERLTIELEQLRREIAKKEKDVMLIMLNIAERGSFMTAAGMEGIRTEIEKQDGTSDLVAEQEKLWILAEEELRRLEAQKDLIFETIGFVKGRMKGEESKAALTDDMGHLLKKKRSDVETKHGPGLLAKRMEDHAKDLEPPNLDTLLRLQDETAELNQRIQRAAALNLQVTSESQMNKDFDENTAALKEGAAPNVDTLQQLSEIVDPQKDWQLDAVADEDARRIQIETERLMKRKGEILQLTQRMVGEQTAVQREWSEHWIALKSVEAELRQKEEIIPMEEDKLRVLQEQHELVAASLACARSNILAATSLQSPRIHTSHPRLPSLCAPGMQLPYRPSTDGDNESASSGSDAARQFSGHSLASPSHAPVRRSLFTDPSSPLPQWCPDAVVAEGVGELLNARTSPTAEWVEVFDEDAVGRIRKSALVAQAALFSQLGKEQEHLKLEVEELERQVQDRLQMTKLSTDGAAEEVAKAAIQDFHTQLKALECIQTSLSGIESIGTSEINNRIAYLGRCQTCSIDELPPFLIPMQEAIQLEKENCGVMRRIADMGPELERLRANLYSFKRSVEPRHRRRMSVAKREQLELQKRNREMRQACRELNIFREQVKRASA